MSINLERLVFDPANPDDGPNMGSYLRAGSDGDLISSTNVGGKEGLDVNVINTISATIAGTYAEDSAVVSGDTVFGAGVQRHDANTTTVSADGDYSLMHVNAVGGLKTSLIGSTGNNLVINADGSINASIVATSDGIYAEDSAAANADLGQSVLQVRQDTLTSSVSADGDYGWFKMNSRGALWVSPVGTVADDAADSENPVKVGGRAIATATALAAVSINDRVDMVSDLYRRQLINDSPNIGLLQQAVSVGTSEVALPTSSLAGRRDIVIQNKGSKSIFVGATGLSVADGIEIGKGASMSMRLGQGVAVFAISTAAAQDVRVLEVA